MPLFTSGGPALPGTIPFRQVLGAVGVLLAVLGVGLENRWVVWAAIAMLAASMVFRVLTNRKTKRN